MAVCEYFGTVFEPKQRRGPKPRHTFCKQSCRVRLAENDRGRRLPHVSIKRPFEERVRLRKAARAEPRDTRDSWGQVHFCHCWFLTPLSRHFVRAFGFGCLHDQASYQVKTSN